MQLAILHNTKIDFLGKRTPFFWLSGLIVLAGLFVLIIKGPNYGIDFSGGILMQVGFENQVQMNEIRSVLADVGIKNLELQSSRDKTGNFSVIIRVKKTDIDEKKFGKTVNDAFVEKFPENAFTIERTEYVGPTVGRYLSKQALYALLFSFLGIIVYVGFRFHSSVWGIAGVLGIMHDVFIVFIIFCVFQKEITLTVIAALLTIAGYSINDTIVVFDRIRENLRLLAKEDYKSVMNKSINQTLSRTVITSFTTFLVAVALFLFGGEVLHDFAFALIIGVVVGTYSSIFVCSAIVYEWEQRRIQRFKNFSKGKSSK